MPVVPVTGVYPSGTTLSITGQVVAGDGHLVGGIAGWQFGTPTVIVGPPPVALGGVPTAQQFGALTLQTAVTVTVPGLDTDPAYLGLETSGHILTEDGSGALLLEAQPVSKFGVPTFKSGVLVPGVASAQAFGVPTTRFIQTVVGPGSAQAFGALTFSTRRTVVVPGVPSAQAFGSARVAFSVNILGVNSAQSFGALRITFGQVVPVQGVLPYGPTIYSITNEVICGDGHLVGWKGSPSEQFGHVTIRTGPVTVAVGGIGSAQAFGAVLAYVVYIRPEDCLDLDLTGIVCTNLDLVGLTEMVLDLAAITSTSLDLEEAVASDLDLQPMGCG